MDRVLLVSVGRSSRAKTVRRLVSTTELSVDRAARLTDIAKPATARNNYIYCESKKLGHFFTASNFRNIEQIFTKFGTNQSLFILNIVPMGAGT